MRIGFANIYSFRPHVHHLVYLSKILGDAGHETFFLTCDGSVDNCYVRSLKKTSKFIECSKCILGGIRSFPVSNITSLSHKVDINTSLDCIEEIALSSSCTLHRTESEEEWSDECVVETRKSFYNSIQKTYNVTLSWIENNKLDAVICFNGRMELTQSIIKACEIMNIPFITHERTWFGDGLHMIPNNNCLSIKSLNKMVEKFDNKPLTSKQAQYAGKLIGQRFLQQNVLEWRLYNKDSVSISWPLGAAKKKVLVLPSSKNEFAGHKEWLTQWKDNTSALDDFFTAFQIELDQVVVRFHPNWSENIGKIQGDRSRLHYQEWAQKRGIYFFDSDTKVNTYDLIQEADIIILNGGSSAVEAGALGKQVICLGHSTYEKAGFVRTFLTKEDMYVKKMHNNLDKMTIIKSTLRYVYLRAKRFPQFVDYVKAKTTTEYEFFKGAHTDKIIKMFQTKDIEPDDSIYADDDEGENGIVELLLEKEWHTLVAFKESIDKKYKERLHVQRRVGLNFIDSIRKLTPRGDR